MAHSIRFVLALHNHQPVGNFDGVFEQAYQDSYRPFLDVLDRFPSLPIALHTSGSLMEWLEQYHPEYVDRLAAMVEAGRLEIIGGAHYEAILPMLPRHDRVGQIRSYTRWLQDRLGCKVRGMWMPERVWEPGLASDLSYAGIEYTILDDFHFKCAGLDDDELSGYYLTEDEGRLLKVFPGSERLRYTIPFQEPQATIDHLRSIAVRHPGAVVVFGDDGEKFGTWPETKAHVYQHGWLERFFEALQANSSWLQMTTLSEALDHVAPVGNIYLPNASYREMTEWALPAERLVEYDHLKHDLEHDPRWPSISKFMRGGFWRNFKVKYPETNEMYCRMMMVSQRLLGLSDAQMKNETLDQAKQALYRGQCNCPYWHGAFGGLYLPHLRNAVFHHLIQADNLIEQTVQTAPRWSEIKAGDYNLDARQEVRLANDKLLALVAPAAGGMLYELDVRSICHNLLATLTRRPEAYHHKVLAGSQGANGAVASIHDRVIFKQADLDQKLFYDIYPRKALLDHFYDNEISHAAVARCQAQERGDFAGGVYEAVLRRASELVQVQLSRQGNAWGVPFTITKSISLGAGRPALRVDYELSGLPRDRAFHFGIELNFAGLPSGADDRYFHQQDRKLGQLGSWLDLERCSQLALKDEWLGIDVQLSLSRPSGIWTFPIETVSQSEAGFELVHQSVCVQPHWIVQGDADGRWQVSMEIFLDTSLAERRVEPNAVAASI